MKDVADNGLSLPLLGNESERINFEILQNRLVKRHDDLILRQATVQKNGSTLKFMIRIISKSSRAKVYKRLTIDRLADPIDGVEKLYNEINIRKKLKHPNILSLYAVRETDLFVILFEEYGGGGLCMRLSEDLQYYIPHKDQKAYSEEEAARIFWDVCNGLYYLHGKEICHLNIRPDRFVRCPSGTTKLTGFPFISNIHDDMLGGLRESFPGDQWFQAPECWKDGLFSSYSADIWSLGVTLYILVLGRLPFQVSSLMDHMTTMKNYSSLPPMEGISDELKALLSSLLNPDVSLRPTLNDVMTSDWLKLYGYVFDEAGFPDKTPLHTSFKSDYSWTSPDFSDYSDVFDHFKVLCDDDYQVSEKSDRKSEAINTCPFDNAYGGNHCYLSALDRECRRLRSRSASCKVELPRKGALKFKSSSWSAVFYRRCCLYIEKGLAVITVPSCKKSIINISLQRAYLVEHTENERLFEIRTDKGDYYLFKTLSSDDCLCWEVSLSYAIRLGR